MRTNYALGAALIAAAGYATGDSFPAGVTYPLRPAEFQPSSLAQSLPSTRRYALVWKDQLADAVISISDAQKAWIVTHYVGTQKLFQHQIDEFRAMNPNFLMLTYHLAYDLDGADQTSPVGNITGPNTFGQEDTDTFTPWIAAHGGNREPAYQHSMASSDPNHRVSHTDPSWLMDVTATEWQQYLFSTLLTWQTFPTTHATGVFLDSAYNPWYGYMPDPWWGEYTGGDTSTHALAAWFNPNGAAYYEAMRAAFAPDGTHPRYLVIPNPDALLDEDPAFLTGTDGAFTENWQHVLDDTGSWFTSCSRIVQYMTGVQKVWMSGVQVDASTLTIAQREMLIGTYFLIRNGTSYYALEFSGGVSWFPEYEIDLGGYVDEPTSDIEALRVSGAGGASGGLYLRSYVSGLVLVNSSTAPLTYMLARPMQRAVFSGGGDVASDGTEATQSLTYGTVVPAGLVTVPGQSAMLLQDPSGPPAPGVEPTSGATDGGVSVDAGVDASDARPFDSPDVGTTAYGDSAADTGADDSSPMGGSRGSCGCRTSGGSTQTGAIGAAMLALAVLTRRRRIRPS